MTSKESKTADYTFVKFSDVKMAAPHTPRFGGTIFSRRNKCLIFVLILTVIFIFLLLNLGVFSNAPAYTGKLCKLSEIPLQSNFDKTKFAGSWYAASTKGLENSLLASLLEFYDVKVNFAVDENGNFAVKSVGGKFYGMWCPEGIGHLKAPDPKIPQQMEVLFDTPTGKKFGTKPVWLVKTDYTSYAVMYSCWEVTKDGYCEASGAYIGVLQRTRDTLPEPVLEDIRTVVSQSCINPAALRPIKHEGYCKKEQNALG